MRAATPEATTRWLLLAWFLAALTFATTRVPYDDEWFSIELSLETDVDGFWYGLEHDVHPAWVAVIDRGLAQATGSVWPLHALRLAATGCALLLLGALWKRQAGLPTWIPVACAFHPIVFMYGGALRWYPFILLAHALRAWALFHPEPGGRRAGAAFVGGAALGASAGYIDLPFVLHDSGWLLWRGHKGRRGRRAGAGIAATAIAVAALVVWASPLGSGGHFANLGPTRIFSPVDAATWAVFGLGGEATLPFPAIVLVVALAAGAVRGFLRLQSEPVSRDWAHWLASYSAVWLVTTGVAVWHPRYSLLVWITTTVLLASLMRRAGAWRVVAGLSMLHLAVGLALMLGGRGFWKGDLNEVDAAQCASITDSDAELYIVPYRRLAAQLGRCLEEHQIVTVPSMRFSREAGQQLTGLASLIDSERRLSLVTVNAPSSLAVTRNRVRTLLAERCRATYRSTFAEPPHLAVKQWVDPNTPTRRFAREDYVCKD